MLDQLIADYTGQPTEKISQLTHTAPTDIHKLAAYKQMLADLDVDLLSKTMVSSRHYMDDNLPPLVQHYKNQFDLDEFPLSGYMVCNWVMAYVKSPHTLPNLLNTHTNVSRDVMKAALPDILEMLGDVPEEGAHWQKAFSTVVIPLIANA